LPRPALRLRFRINMHIHNCCRSLRRRDPARQSCAYLIKILILICFQ
jgi:hypothetical protein